MEVNRDHPGIGMATSYTEVQVSRCGVEAAVAAAAAAAAVASAAAAELRPEVEEGTEVGATGAAAEAAHGEMEQCDSFLVRQK
jgi:hypothetical protein